MPTTLVETHLPLQARRQGKVRDIYDATLNEGTPVLLIVASDRISAYDVVMPNPIPGKGVVLTQISRFWFDMIGKKLGGKLRHHLISTDATDVAGLSDEQREELRGRVMVGRKCKVVPIECVVRGYLAGSGWNEYKKSQTVCGVKLPPGLRQCEKLPEPIFTPSTKEETGHDINISFEEMVERIGRELATKLRDHSLAIYTTARDYAATRGIIIADTKFEFGIPLSQGGTPSARERVAAYSQPGEGASSHPGRDLRAEPKEAASTLTPALSQREREEDPILIDEVLTPDSSRFWPAAQYEPGHDQPSFDKQYVRNYLETLVSAGKWDKTPPAPKLPDEVVRNTLAKYLEAYRALTGSELQL